MGVESDHFEMERFARGGWIRLAGCRLAGCLRITSHARLVPFHSQPELLSRLHELLLVTALRTSI